MAWFFTSDLHIGHGWVSNWRGFNTIAQHDAEVMDQWNNTVGRSDIVVVLGDTFWPNHPDICLPYLKKLNGSKVFVKGNHDRWLKRAKTPFRRIYQRRINDTYVVCCHYPLWSWNRKAYGAIHLHGHSHGMTYPRVSMLDVGVDSASVILGSLRPFSYDEVVYLTKTTGGKHDRYNE